MNTMKGCTDSKKFREIEIRGAVASEDQRSTLLDFDAIIIWSFGT